MKVSKKETVTTYTLEVSQKELDFLKDSLYHVSSAYNRDYCPYYKLFKETQKA